MKIVILGAGQVGGSVAESLVSEANDITVVDIEPQRLRALQERLDLRTVVGSGAHPSVLVEAGIDDADLLVAVTQSDETNLVACRIAARMFNVPRRIARVRATDYLANERVLGEDGFDVDLSICPEQVLTDYIVKLVEFPEALQVLDFAGGKVSLVAVRAFAGGPLVGHPLKDLRRHIPRVDARIVAIFRGDGSIVPEGDTVIEDGRRSVLPRAAEHIREVMRELRRMDRPVRRVMIAGGGNIGLRLALALEERYSVKVIEHNKRRCELIAARLGEALVLNGDTTDEELLESENIGEMDLFVAVTNDDENNIMSSLLAKRMGARKVVSLINAGPTSTCCNRAQIDIAISPAQATIGTLLAHVRRGDWSPCTACGAARRKRSRPSCTATGESCKLIDRRVGRDRAAAAAPRSARSCAATRSIMAHHDTVIRAEDHVIVFVTDKKNLPRVERMFQVGVRFM